MTRSILLSASVVILVTAQIAFAWPTDPDKNLLGAGGPGDQWQVQIISDGAGGAVIAWEDNRDNNPDIYAQRILPGGRVHPSWPTNRRPLCTAIVNQVSPMLVGDGTGGAIVTWADSRAASYDIYAQHVQANGTVDPAWPVNGRALCTAANNQSFPTIVSDGAGGAIVT